jgi:hypothetical protein
MKEYSIEYIGSRFILLIPAILLSILFFVLKHLVFDRNLFLQISLKNELIGIALFSICFVIIGVIVCNYVIKIFLKRMKIMLFNDHLDINYGERLIYFKNIQLINLKTYKGRHGITGYIIKIQYNNTEKFKIDVLTGSSKKEKNNYRLFLELYNEINLNYKENK